MPRKVLDGVLVNDNRYVRHNEKNENMYPCKEQTKRTATKLHTENVVRQMRLISKGCRAVYIGREWSGRTEPLNIT